MAGVNAPPPDPATAAMIAEIWERMRPLLLTRLDALDEAASEHAAGTLSAEGRAEAESTAHKLAGSLGLYGYTEGGQHARRLEQRLQALAADPAAEGPSLAELAAALRASLDG